MLVEGHGDRAGQARVDGEEVPVVGDEVPRRGLLDVRDDRKHVVVVNARTPVFIGSGDEDCDARRRITTVEKGVKLPIERIRYQKNCATLDVLLPDGRKGYVVLGVGDVSVKPPLPTI